MVNKGIQRGEMDQKTIKYGKYRYINQPYQQLNKHTNKCSWRGRKGASLATQQLIEVEIVLIFCAVLCVLM